MYKTPRCAFASSPGSKIGRPASMDACTSNDPTSLSSVQPKGNSMKGQSMIFVLTSPLSSLTMRSRLRTSHSEGLLGSQLQMEFSTTSIFGRTPRKERARVVFPVPCPPEIPTPPREGSMQASFKASLTSSRPSTRVMGITIPLPLESASFGASFGAALTLSSTATLTMTRLRLLEALEAAKGIASSEPAPSESPETLGGLNVRRLPVV
mmetsp:Transcript_67354/g.106204  ORF Transcript_67354/g.106204 Transcript_67354/m.106204 type:complete len:209 (-) Transcript_67354:37-663(-)